MARAGGTGAGAAGTWVGAAGTGVGAAGTTPPAPFGIGAFGIGAFGIGAFGIGAFGIGTFGIGTFGIGAFGIGADGELSIGADAGTGGPNAVLVNPISTIPSATIRATATAARTNRAIGLPNTDRIARLSGLRGCFVSPPSGESGRLVDVGA